VLCGRVCRFVLGDMEGVEDEGGVGRTLMAGDVVHGSVNDTLFV
jgi:hypothetical protein